jgi:hypothetical protein
LSSQGSEAALYTLQIAAADSRRIFHDGAGNQDANPRLGITLQDPENRRDTSLKYRKNPNGTDARKQRKLVRETRISNINSYIHNDQRPRLKYGQLCPILPL